MAAKEKPSHTSLIVAAIIAPWIAGVNLHNLPRRLRAGLFFDASADMGEARGLATAALANGWSKLHSVGP